MRDHAAVLSRHGVMLGMLWWGLTTSMAAWAADEAVPPAQAVPAVAVPALDIEIPAQPLAVALDRYASLTSRAVLFRSEIVAGRTSSAVRGRYTPEAALSLLLQGSGLVSEKIDEGPADAFVLRAVGPPAMSLQAALASAGDYPGLLQARIWDALCGNPRAVLGRYRALLRFQVDAGGRLVHPRLLTSTGDARRDTAMLGALDGVRIGAPPPAGMPQPLTMLVLPDDPGSPQAGRRCQRDALS